ncbi:MAG: glycogen debranching protein [Cyclobacteriaceae bacterium]
MTLLSLVFICCSEKTNEDDYSNRLSKLPSIEGTAQYLPSPFVTAGDRVYMVGHQDGSFPDLGWHIQGEMGGIWDHPVKLMDGFAASIAVKGSNDLFCLNRAENFINYPIGNSHHYSWDKENLTVTRFQFVPDGLEGIIIEFRIGNQAPERKEIVFSFTGMVDLRPTWLGERTNMIDAKDEVSFDEKLAAVIAKDQNNPWYVAIGSSGKGRDYSEEGIACQPVDRKGSGIDATLTFSIELKSNQEEVITIFIAGSYESENALRKTYALLKQGKDSKLTEKIRRYEKIDSISHLTIPDKDLEQMYEWLKYNTDWLVRDVPEQGRGLSAGLPDYPWWFGADMAYSLQGILATGDHALARNSIILLNRISQKTNGNGRIIHEVSTNGSVYNAGNVNETAQFISVLMAYFAWTGDKELMVKLFPDIEKGMKWLLEDMDPDGNGYPNGSGMMEIPGLDTEMIDVAVYTQQALEAAAEIARTLGEMEIAADYQKRAQALKLKINKEWWNPQDQSFGDFRGTVAEAKPIVEAALIRADTLNKPWAVDELKETKKNLRRYPSDQHVPHVVYHNWVVNTPMETGIADFEKGQKALRTAMKYENPFGVFVTGIDRSDDPDSVVLKSRKKTFSYTGAVMTLPTGVQAVAAARYGSPEDALAYLKKLQRSFSYALPGSMYEVSPDFGMVTQGWNIYGVAVPLVNHFFGIQPKAYEKTVCISPRMPLSWKEASLENVKVGSNALSLTVHQKEDHNEYRIRQTQPDWRVIVDIKNARKVVMNNEQQDLDAGADSIVTQGREITLQIYD